MNANQRKLLEMLAEKKITVDEAERLMSLLQPEGEAGCGETKNARETRTSPKYLRIEVKPNPENKSDHPENVNIRVPIALLRAGIKLTSVIPPSAYAQVDSALKEKGIDFDLRNIRPEDLEGILVALNDLEIDVQNGRQKVHIYAE